MRHDKVDLKPTIMAIFQGILILCHPLPALYKHILTNAYQDHEEILQFISVTS